MRADWYAVPEYWPGVEKWVEKALEGRSISLRAEDIYQGCLCRGMTLWLVVPGPRACAVTEITQQKYGKLCQMLVVGGEGMGDWLRFEPEIAEYAREQGCDFIEVAGRKGWARVMPDYEPVYMIYRRTL